MPGNYAFGLEISFFGEYEVSFLGPQKPNFEPYNMARSVLIVYHYLRLSHPSSLLSCFPANILYALLIFPVCATLVTHFILELITPNSVR